MSMSTLYSYFTGHSLPSDDRLAKILETLKVPADEAEAQKASEKSATKVKPFPPTGTG